MIQSQVNIIAGEPATKRLMDAVRREAAFYTPGEQSPSEMQVASVLHALADHTAIMKMLVHRPDPESPWPQATSVGRWFHDIGHELEDLSRELKPYHPMDDLTETQLKILQIMITGIYSDGSFVSHNFILTGGFVVELADFSDEVGGKKGLSKELKKLRDLGYVEYSAGLMSEEGEVAGSGNGVVESKRGEIWDYLESKGAM